MSQFDHLANRRAIIDRRAIAERIAAMPDAIPATIVPLLKDALAAGRAEIARRLAERPSRGLEAAAGQAYLTDQILRLLFESAVRLYPAAEPIALVAVGG